MLGLVPHSMQFPVDGGMAVAHVDGAMQSSIHFGNPGALSLQKMGVTGAFCPVFVWTGLLQAIEQERVRFFSTCGCDLAALAV